MPALFELISSVLVLLSTAGAVWKGYGPRPFVLAALVLLSLSTLAMVFQAEELADRFAVLTFELWAASAVVYSSGVLREPELRSHYAKAKQKA